MLFTLLDLFVLLISCRMMNKNGRSRKTSGAPFFHFQRNALPRLKVSARLSSGPATAPTLTKLRSAGMMTSVILNLRAGWDCVLSSIGLGFSH